MNSNLIVVTNEELCCRVCVSDGRWFVRASRGDEARTIPSADYTKVIDADRALPMLHFTST